MIRQEILGNRAKTKKKKKKKKKSHLQGSREDKCGTQSHSLQKTSNPIMNNEL